MGTPKEEQRSQWAALARTAEEGVHPKLAFPQPAEEVALHERVLAGDPVAPVDVFQGFMDPLVDALQRDLRSQEDEAHDSAVDALLAYLEEPGRYDREKGHLSTYLMDIAKKRSIDRLRCRTAQGRREEAYAAVVELSSVNPKERLERTIEAHKLWRKAEEVVPNERDRRALKLILSGERSTEVLAEALDLAQLSPFDQRREVKQHRDRLMKVLQRLGTRLSHDEDA